MMKGIIDIICNLLYYECTCMLVLKCNSFLTYWSYIIQLLIGTYSIFSTCMGGGEGNVILPPSGEKTMFYIKRLLSILKRTALLFY